MNSTPEDDIANAVRKTTAAFQQYGPWAVIGILLVTMLVLSKDKRR